MPFLLGFPRGAPLFTALQPFDRAAPDVDRHFHQFYFLDLAAYPWFRAGDDHGDESNQPALPVLDPYGTRRLSGSLGKSVKHTIAPSRASWFESSLHRPQSWRHTDHLGQTLRLVRTGRSCQSAAFWPYT